MSYNSLGVSPIPSSQILDCVYIKTLDFVSLMYRVDRVLGFFSKSTELGPAPTLSPPGECVPSPFGSG
jgi:hypothetical protein